MTVGFVIWIVMNTGNYYADSLLDRPHNPLHREWKPGGFMGHGLGIVGSLMMVIMFVYSLRKRVRFFRNLGKLPTWLNYHIFLGIAGPILVTFHTAFKFGGLVSISYWSMVAVASSGFIGRYIYIKIPHRVSGKELSRDEFKDKFSDMIHSFKKEFHLSDEIIEQIEDLSGASKIESRGLWGIFTIFFMDITSWFKWNKIKKKLQISAHLSPDKMKSFQKSVRQIVKMDRQIAFWNAAHSLFHYWHVIHKPFAYTMIVIMIVHITVVVAMGYTWIF
jgi:hypothetical protein